MPFDTEDAAFPDPQDPTEPEEIPTAAAFAAVLAVPTTSADWTLTEVVEWLRDRVDDGAHCPACTQMAKVYRRKISSSTARVLIAMHRDRTDPDGWVQVPRLREVEKGGDSTKARYWGLIEPMPNVVRDDGSSRVGWWRLTPAGRAFVRNQISVATYARIYDGRLVGFDATTTTTIHDALGTRFHYDDLMAGR